MGEINFDDESFREEYRRAFDNIHASDELRSRILGQKKPKRRDMRPYMAAAGAAAAGLAIFAAVHNYDLTGREDGIINETSSVTDSDRSDEHSDPALPGNGAVPGSSSSQKPSSDGSAASEAPAAQSPAASEDRGTLPQSSAEAGTQRKTTEDYMKEALEKSGVDGGVSSDTYSGSRADLPADYSLQVETDDSNSGARFEAESGGKATYSVEIPQGDQGSSSSSSGSVEKDTDGSAIPPLKSARTAGNVLLNMNSPSVYAAYEAQVYGVTESAYDTSGYHLEKWDDGRYFDYLGANITEKADLADDFAYTGGGEMSLMVDADGTPMNDSRIFAFEGNNGRYVNIITSRETVYADTYLADPDLLKSDIAGTDAIVFDMGGSYKCYMVYGGVSYVIDAEGIDETELSYLLLSLAG